MKIKDLPKIESGANKNPTIVKVIASKEVVYP